MIKGWDRRRLIGTGVLAALGVALLVLLLLSIPGGGSRRDEAALVGEARFDVLELHDDDVHDHSIDSVIQSGSAWRMTITSHGAYLST